MLGRQRGVLVVSLGLKRTFFAAAQVCAQAVRGVLSSVFKTGTNFELSAL